MNRKEQSWGRKYLAFFLSESFIRRSYSAVIERYCFLFTASGRAASKFSLWSDTKYEVGTEVTAKFSVKNLYKLADAPNSVSAQRIAHSRRQHISRMLNPMVDLKLSILICYSKYGPGTQVTAMFSVKTPVQRTPI